MSAADEAVVRRFYEQMCNERKNDLAPELFTADHQLHDHAGQRCAQVDDRGLVPVRQHERHHAARWHPRHQIVRQGDRPRLQRLAVDPNVAVDQNRSLGRALCGIAEGVGECSANPQPAAVRVRAIFVDPHAPEPSL